MGSSAQDLAQESDREFLEAVRGRYERQGYKFTIAPDRSTLPSFLGTYVPDAVAERDGRFVAIEVKRRQQSGERENLQSIRRLFDGHPDWQLAVLYMRSGPLESVLIPSAPIATIRAQLDEVRALSAAGHDEAAFVASWSLLEATLQSLSDSEIGKPRTPGTVVQTLAMLGRISAATEAKLRNLISLRNRIVHGDMTARATPADVALVMEAIEEALAADAA